MLAYGYVFYAVARQLLNQNSPEQFVLHSYLLPELDLQRYVKEFEHFRHQAVGA